MLHFDKIPLYGVLILSFGSGIVAAVLVHFFVSPYLKKKILKEVYGDEDEQEKTVSGTSHGEVSFTKSPTLSEPRVNENKQDITGMFIYCNFNHSQEPPFSPTFPQLSPWAHMKWPNIIDRWGCHIWEEGVLYIYDIWFVSRLQHFFFKKCLIYKHI